MNISFEIVPRNWAAFSQQYEFVKSLGNAVNIINVPDIQRFPIRSWEVASHVDKACHTFIPHFRAIDFKLGDDKLFNIIEAHQLQQLLLVSGDPPDGLSRQFYNTSVIEMIAAVKRHYPALKVYAGFDPHRNGLQAECEYIQRKIDAGAIGFFSQPFYDERMIDIYVEQMQNVECYIGLSPITTKASQNYWEVKNNVRFPQYFQPDYQWQIDFGNRVLQRAQQEGFNVYFMPIKIDLKQYFSQLNLPTN